jgi:UPF0042 nucleotide-binding protein
MSAQSTNQLDSKTSAKEGRSKRELEVTITSFGYKQGSPPLANVVFDVRFLKNPYWVEELRPLTGLDKKVQDYVLNQPLATQFIDGLLALFEKVLPKVQEHKVEHYLIALGCTGGQHRSTTLVEELGKRMKEQFPQYSIVVKHRELAHLSKSCADPDMRDVKTP